VAFLDKSSTGEKLSHAMCNRKLISAALLGSVGLVSLLSGCESDSGGQSDHGSVLVGVGGAGTGAILAKHNNDPDAPLIGGALGAGGGYLIGVKPDMNDPKHRDQAIEASQHAERSPAAGDDVWKSGTADLNNDGYVTMDEVVAMRRAGMSDDEMIDRLGRTKQVFDLTDWQRNYLRDHGLDARVIDAMLKMDKSEVAQRAETY
jgi:surface antigen